MKNTSLKIAIFQLSLFGINTYIVYDPISKDAAIIDPGMSNQREQDALDTFIEKEGLKITHIINTHLHIDHAIGNSYASEKYQAPVLANKLDAPLGQNILQQAQMFGLNINPKGVEISQYISDGDKIKIGNGELTAIHVPGHSPGSIVLYDKADGFMIAGDVLFLRSIGRTDLPGGNHQDLINGIKNKLFTLPDDTKVYPGHGDPTTIGYEKSHNPFF